MSSPISFHPLVQKDLNEIIAYYESEATLEIAARFEAAFRAAVISIKDQPRHFPFYLNQRHFRRCTIRNFPHLILHRETSETIRITVLKHVKRAPDYGLRRI